MLKVEKVEVGYLQENCYIISQNAVCLVVDPGDEIDKILNKIGSLKPIGILITHYHADHVGAKEQLQKKYNLPIYDIYHVEDNQTFTIGPFHFKTLFTKGHDDTSITFYFEKEKMMFVGDFIFKNSIGRTDLATGNMNKMQESIYKIKQYPNDILIYPGHGPSTILGYEKQNNIYFNE